jgi:hypothetical protein
LFERRHSSNLIRISTGTMVSKAVPPVEANDPNLVRKPKELVLPMEDEIDSDDADSPGSSVRNVSCECFSFSSRFPQILISQYGNGYGDHRIHKQARLNLQSDRTEEVTDLWWKAVVCDPLLAGGVPGIHTRHHEQRNMRQRPHASPGKSRNRSRKRQN